jgi:hypothetical protein
LGKTLNTFTHQKLSRALFWAIFILALIFLAHRGLGKTDEPTKSTMHKFLSDILALQPFLSSDDAFNDPKNQNTIAVHLISLNQWASDAADHFDLKKMQYSFSREVLKTQFNSALQAYEFGNKQYARDAINSSLSLCMSCHTQLPAKSRPSAYLTTLVEKPDLPEDMFKQAELVFTMWEFDWALGLYDKMIAGYPKNKLSKEQIQTCLERKLSIFARIKRDPKAGIASFTKDLKNHKLPPNLKKDIQFWISEFRSWASEQPIDVKTAGDDEIHRYITQNLVTMEEAPGQKKVDSPNIVTLLKISGVLYEYLNTRPSTTLKPDILYWLAICDKKVNQNYFYSLSDLYLRECIMTYPKSELAPKCFAEYKKNTLDHYLYHHENKVPPEVQTELDRFEKSVKPN